MKILLMENEASRASYLRKGLVDSGFTVDVMGSDAARAGFRRTHYDLLVCDLPPDSPLPDNLDLSEIRREGQRAPVLYLGKPVTFSDLLGRVRGAIASSSNQTAMHLRYAGLELDFERHRASRDSRRLDLTPKEFLLLSLLVRRSGEVLSRAFIADQVWDINFDSKTNFVDVHIRRLRSKVDDPFPTKLIHTVRGMGYVLEER